MNNNKEDKKEIVQPFLPQAKDVLVEKIEAILFASGDPVSISTICDATDSKRRNVLEAISRIEEKLSRGFGIMLVRIDDSIQFTTRPEYSEVIRSAVNTKRKTPLSTAAMEVLAIIAYNQPVTKNFIERVRETDSSSIVNNLAERELIEEAGRLPLPGRPMTFKTTDNFLRCFGIKSLSELPPPPKKIPDEYVSLPDGTVVSEISETAKTPETPEISETPETPEISETPETPEITETAEISETAETPEVVETSEASETAKTSELPL